MTHVNTLQLLCEILGKLELSQISGPLLIVAISVNAARLQQICWIYIVVFFRQTKRFLRNTQALSDMLLFSIKIMIYTMTWVSLVQFISHGSKQFLTGASQKLFWSMKGMHAQFDPCNHLIYRSNADAEHLLIHVTVKDACSMSAESFCPLVPPSNDELGAKLFVFVVVLWKIIETFNDFQRMFF